jgi:hypothetical protein
MSIENIGELPLWQDEAAQKILDDLSKKHGVPLNVLKELVASEQQNVGREKRRGIYTDFDTALDGIEENI